MMWLSAVMTYVTKLKPKHVNRSIRSQNTRDNHSQPTGFELQPTDICFTLLKRLPGMRETWVQSLGWEDPLEKEMATHSSTLAWKIPWTEEPGRLQPMGSQRVGHD